MIPTSDGGSSLTIITRAQFELMGKALHELARRAKCEAVLLADASGLVLSQAGDVRDLNIHGLAAVAAADFAATQEIARLVGEPGGFGVHLHEGRQRSLYIASVTESTFLIVVFSPRTTFGMIRVMTEKCLEKLREAIALQQTTGEVVGKETDEASRMRENPAPTQSSPLADEPSASATSSPADLDLTSEDADLLSAQLSNILSLKEL